MLRAEARGAVPMALGLIVTVALLMLGARYQFEMAPEAMIKNRSLAWGIVAMAAMVPLAAELFGSSGRAVRASALQPLPVSLSQVFVAKLGVLLSCVALTWLCVGAADLALDLSFPRTKLEAGSSPALTRLLLGTPVLALLVTALAAATIKNALGSTLLGLLTLIVVGAAVLGYIAPPYRSSTLGAWGLSAAYFAVHPVIFALALGSLAWASMLRGRASATSSGATLRRSIAAVTLALAAPVVALGASAIGTGRSALLGFDDPSARLYRVIPSPDASQLIVNLFGAVGAQESNSWIVDVASGGAQPVLTPQHIAANIPFGGAQTWATSWSSDGRSVGLEIHPTLPWLEVSGALNLDDREFVRGASKAWSHHELSRWHHVDSEGYRRAVERFRAESSEEAARLLEELAPRYLHSPRRAPGVVFGFTKDTKLRRIDGATGELTVMEQLPYDMSCSYRVDPLGIWVAEYGSSSLVHGVTGNVMHVPEGWAASRSSFQDMIVRGDAVLVSRSHGDPADPADPAERGVDWAWLEGGALGNVLPGVDAYEMVDLDGDRMIAVSHERQTVELLDREGRVLRTLRAPAATVGKP